MAIFANDVGIRTVAWETMAWPAERSWHKSIPPSLTRFCPENGWGGYEEAFAALPLGCLVQSCAANSLERCAWKFRLISSMVSPVESLEEQKTQAH
jgi:hypothetical protein